MDIRGGEINPVNVFSELPPPKQAYMEYLFQNCTEEVRYYMRLIEVDADRTLIKAGEPCSFIYIILTGRVTGIEWPMHERSYAFKDYGPGDFFGEIECFADLANYRISVETATECRVLTIPAVYYMEWMQQDLEALYLRTKENMRRLVMQTAEARKYLFIEGRERLMIYLVRKYEQRQPKNELELNKSRNRISDEIGFSVKTLNRNIKKLEDLEVLRIEKGKIVVGKEGYTWMRDYLEKHIDGQSG